MAVASPEQYLADLNPPQREAVLATEGPLLVIAGAGSGKTRVLTYRVAHLINAVGAKSNEILAITFTNKAAGEMRERLQRLLGASGRGLWILTFHAACGRILRRGLVGERDREDLIRLHADRVHEMRDAVGEDARLARAGAGDHEQRPLGRQHRLPLGRVQVGEVVLRLRDGHAPDASGARRRSFRTWPALHRLQRRTSSIRVA